MTKKYYKLLLVSSAALGLFGATLDASAVPTEIYNSNGFESFSDGGLPTQDGWFDFAAGTGGNSTATVFSDAGLAADGNKAVRIDRAGADGSTGSTGFGVPLPTAPQERYVIIEFDLNATDINANSVFGPGFGIELFTTGNNQVAGFGIDAGDASFFQFTVDDILFSDEGLVREVYQEWMITVDLVDEQYTVVVDGNTIGTTAFFNGAFFDYDFGDRITDASIVTFATDGSAPNAEGVAYIDNYIVTTEVPEPSSVIAIVVLGGTVFARRRRRCCC